MKGLFDVFPRSTTQNSANAARRQVESSCEPTAAKTLFGPQSPHFPDICLGAFRVVLSFTTSVSSFINAIFSIINLVPQKEMGKITAQAIIAAVENKVRTGIDSGLEKVCNAMCPDVGIANSERAIPVNESAFPLPLPALVGCGLVHVVPKALNALRWNEGKRRIRFGHGLKSPFKLCLGSFGAQTPCGPFAIVTREVCHP